MKNKVILIVVGLIILIGGIIGNNIYNKSTSVKIDSYIKEYIIQNKLLKTISKYDYSVPEPISFDLEYGKDNNGVERVIMLYINEEKKIDVLDNVKLENTFTEKAIENKLTMLGYDKKKYKYSISIYPTDEGMIKYNKLKYSVAVIDKKTNKSNNKTYDFDIITGEMECIDSFESK